MVTGFAHPRPQLGDGSDAFDPDVLAADLEEVAELYAGLAGLVASDHWMAQSSDDAWSSAQTIAHLDVMTAAGLDAIDDAIDHRTPVFEGISERRGLNAWNEASSLRRLMRQDDPLDSLVTGLGASADLARRLSPDDLRQTVRLPIYNAPISVVELLGVQASHPALVHAAQAVTAGHVPLWARLSPATRHRMITRLVRALGYLYWPERGGPGGVTIALEVSGPDGGSWHIAGTPTGAIGRSGRAENPNLTLRFRDMATACRLFTNRLPIVRSLLRRDLRVRGDIRILLRFEQLFSADG